MTELHVKLVPIESFYNIHAEWCKQHKFPVIHIDNIEDCFVCYKGDTPIYSVFFYSTGSKICVLGFPISNPNVSYKDRDGGLDYLLDEVSKYAKDKGFYLLWTTSSTSRVIDSLERTGFVIGDVNVNQYIRLLK